ncbi:hypothetical protein L7F22_029271 [Adiantum nelumboides]|nr:hypothetical protein [Adiantum nelumboides]
MPRRREEKDAGSSIGRKRGRHQRPAESRSCEHSRTPPPPKRKKKASSSSAPAKETRLARFIPKPNTAVQDRIGRAFTHRLYVIDKKLSGAPPSECDFFVLGATGNVYTVKLSLLPSCTCPDHEKGNVCKHILFVMLRVLKLPRDDPRVWQKALLPSELHGLLKNLSVSDAVLASSGVRQRFSQITGVSLAPAVEPLKPLQRDIDSDCPICYEPMASSDGKPSEPVIFCKSCGNNVHADCFKKWSQSKKHGSVTCIYCRAVWETNAKGAGPSSHGEGEYINLAAYSDAHRPEETTIEALYPSSHQWWHRYR